VYGILQRAGLNLLVMSHFSFGPSISDTAGAVSISKVSPVLFPLVPVNFLQQYGKFHYKLYQVEYQ